MMLMVLVGVELSLTMQVVFVIDMATNWIKNLMIASR